MEVMLVLSLLCEGKAEDQLAYCFQVCVSMVVHSSSLFASHHVSRCLLQLFDADGSDSMVST